MSQRGGTRRSLLVTAMVSAAARLNAQNPAREAFDRAEQLRRKATPEARRQAIAEYENALTLSRQSGGGDVERRSLSYLGQLHDLLGERPRALERFREALPLHRAAGDRRFEALTLYGLGQVHWSMGEAAEALANYEAALPLRTALGDRFEVGLILNNIGGMHWSLGDPPRALESYEGALAVRREMKDSLGEAYTLYGMGAAHWSMGEIQKAVDRYHETLPLFRAAKNRAGEGNILNSLGLALAALGERERALDLYAQALAIWRETRNPVLEGYTLGNIGMAWADAGDLTRALDHYRRARGLLEPSGDRRGLAYTLHNQGVAHLEKREASEALDCFRRALELKRAIGDRWGEAHTMHSLGESLHRSGDLPAAAQHYREALALRRACGDREGEALTLASLARAQRDSGDAASARAAIETALRLVESARVEVAGQDLRSSYFAGRRGYYEFYVDLLAPSDAAAALEASERGRARSLLDLMAEATVDLRDGVDAKLLAEDDAIHRRIRGQAERLSRLFGADAPDAEREAARKRIGALLDERARLGARIRSAHPRFARVAEPEPLTLDGVRRRVVDDGSVLLEYSLGKERSWLIAAGRDWIECHPLPGRGEIEDATRRVVAQLAMRDAAAPGAEARALAKTLIGPVTKRLGGQRLVIVAEGALPYLPFAALPLAGEPLVARHEIVCLPSATALAAHREQIAGRPRAPGALAVLADPVFSAGDGRAKADAAGAAPSRWTRLRFSREEANAIRGLAPPAGTLAALDFEASRTLVDSGKLAGYRMVHFATHAEVDSRRPDLSEVVLSQVDERGRAQNGSLRLFEVYRLRLTADLVVLSGCQTALGKVVRGEGVVGLARGFMYAGARSVVASLWNVEDRATAELMRAFYEAMLKRRLGPAAALREAQLGLLRGERWRSPYYWAGFVMQGDWRWRA